MLTEEKPLQNDIKIKAETVSKHFPAGTSAKEMQDTIEKVLDMYFKRQRVKAKGHER